MEIKDRTRVGLEREVETLEENDQGGRAGNMSK